MKKQPGSLPISQAALAAYIGVSGSLLSMANTGRHGTRRLGVAQSKKMTDLELAHLQSQKSGAPGSSFKKIQQAAADGARLVKKMLTDANHAAAHVTVLERRLAEMKRKQQQDMEWMNTVDLLLTSLPKSRESANDRIWLQNQQVIFLKRVQKNGLPEQVKLEVQIETEKTKARIYREAIKKLPKK